VSKCSLKRAPLQGLLWGEKESHVCAAVNRRNHGEEVVILAPELALEWR